MGKLRAAAPRVGLMAPTVKMAPKVAETFYQSPAWRQLVARRKRDPDYQAALARCKPGERVILDHDRERKDGGAGLDPANTKWLTFTEHQAKTATARKARARGQPHRGGE